MQDLIFAIDRYNEALAYFQRNPKSKHAEDILFVRLEMFEEALGYKL